MITHQDGFVITDECRSDPERVHDVVMLAYGSFVCNACGHLAFYSWNTDRWVVMHPFIIFEEPW